MSPIGVALVTGSGKRRVGWHVAQALADRGYALVVHYYISATEADETVAAFQAGRRGPGRSSGLYGRASVQWLMDQTLARFHQLDVLVNCASDWRSKRLEDVTAADVRHYFETNTLGTFLCCQLAGLVMVRQPKGGCIVTLGDWAVTRPYRNYAAYLLPRGRSRR